MESGIRGFDIEEAVDNLLPLLKCQGLRAVRFNVLPRLAIQPFGQELGGGDGCVHVGRVGVLIHRGDVGDLAGHAHGTFGSQDIGNGQVERVVALLDRLGSKLGKIVFQLLPLLAPSLFLGFCGPYFSNRLMRPADLLDGIYIAAMRLYFLSRGRASANIAFSREISWSVLRPHE